MKKQTTTKTKYFCRLEKRNYIPKQMTKLTLNNGEEIYESKGIIKEGKIFYEEVKVFYDRLCSKSRIKDCKILDMAHDIPMLTLQEKTSLEGEITLVKVIFALKIQKPCLRWIYC